MTAISPCQLNMLTYELYCYLSSDHVAFIGRCKITKTCMQKENFIVHDGLLYLVCHMLVIQIS